MKNEREWRAFRRAFFREHQRLAKLIKSANRQVSKRGAVNYQTLTALDWVDFRLKALDLKLNDLERKMK